MSYILDALKRADAERTRGAVPGLHTRQVARPPVSPAGPVARHRPWLVAGAALALCAIAAGLWRWQAPASGWGAGTPAPLAEPDTAPAPVAPQPAPQPVSQPAPRPAPAASAVPSPVPPKPRPRPDTRPETVTQAPASAPVTATATATAPRAAVPLLSDLADSVRRDIPPLAITGSVYSDNPGKRLLLVNNQVLPQGSLAAPEVRLEEIHAKDSVFSFRGVRFRLAH